MNCFSRVRVLIAVPICRHGTKMEFYPTEQLWILCVTFQSFFWIRNYMINWFIFIDGFDVYQHRYEVGFGIVSVCQSVQRRSFTFWRFPSTMSDYEEIFLLLMFTIMGKKLFKSMTNFQAYTYVSLQLRVQNAVSAQPCVGKFRISLVLLNFLHCNFRLWFKTP